MASSVSSGCRITVRELRSEVALHYLFNFSQSRLAAAVNSGVEAARAWCQANDVAGSTPAREVEGLQPGVSLNSSNSQVRKGTQSRFKIDWHSMFITVERWTTS